jgi:hypothetical protein
MRGLLVLSLVLLLCAVSCSSALDRNTNLNPPLPIYALEDPPNPPAGPPLPSSQASGSIGTDQILEAMHVVLTECLEGVNKAFAGEGDHGRIRECESCSVEEVDDWMCADPSWWNEKHCGQLWRSGDDGSDQWFVWSDNWLHYKVNFGYGLSRHIYIRVPIFIYCDGWDSVVGGRIKVVQQETTAYFGKSGTWENILDFISSVITFGYADLKGVIESDLSKQISGDAIGEMGHEVIIEGLNGQPCISLGIGSYPPYENAEIRWDIPPFHPLRPAKQLVE